MNKNATKNNAKKSIAKKATPKAKELTDDQKLAVTKDSPVVATPPAKAKKVKPTLEIKPWKQAAQDAQTVKFASLGKFAQLVIAISMQGSGKFDLASVLETLATQLGHGADFSQLGPDYTRTIKGYLGNMTIARKRETIEKDSTLRPVAHTLEKDGEQFKFVGDGKARIQTTAAKAIAKALSK